MTPKKPRSHKIPRKMPIKGRRASSKKKESPRAHTATAHIASRTTQTKTSTATHHKPRPAAIIPKQHATHHEPTVHAKKKKRPAIVTGGRRLTKKHALMGVAGVLLVGATIAGSMLLLGNREAPQLNSIEEREIMAEPPRIVTEPAKLSGVQVDPQLNERPVVGVMIENSIDARPQSGLGDAEVVFEAVAEGGITRFLALYQTTQPSSIGPIRSARPYYVQWAAGFDAGYVHSGGSPEALALVRTLGLKDMDHGNYPNYFERVSSRFAPHNVYTTTAQLDSLRQDLGYTQPSSFSEFARIEPAETEPPADPTDPEAAAAAPATPDREKATSIQFNISGPNYNTSYSYNADTNTYGRVMAGVPHLDANSGQQISPSVVVALIAPQGIHPNGIHTTYGNIGSGTATVFQNGEVYNGTWSKPTNTASLTLTDASGADIQLQPGQTWITVLPSGRTTYTP